MCVHPLQVVVLLCTLLYSTVYNTVVQYLYLKPRMSGSKHKSSGDVAGTAKKCQAITMETKVKIIERVEREEKIACPLSPIADNPSALPSPTSFPSSSQ